MKKNRGIAIIPLIIGIVLVGVAGFSIYNWVKTKSQAQADKEVAEQREKEFKAALDDAQQEAEENAEKAADLEEALAKTEEAMKLAEEKAKQDAEEKAAMLAELEEKLAEEEEAKKEAQEKMAQLNEEIDDLESKIADAKQRERMLRASSGRAITLKPEVSTSLASVLESVAQQKGGLEAIKSFLSGSAGQVSKMELQQLLSSLESGLNEAEKHAVSLQQDLISSGDYSASSAVGQAVYDLQQTTQKQRAILNSLKSFLSNAGETVAVSDIEQILSDLEASITELEDRQASLDDTLNAEIDYAGDESDAIASFEREIRAAQAELATAKRQLASAEAARQAAIERQKELEKLSIEIRYDIDYQMRSFSYARRLHSMYNRIAHPEEELEEE